MKARLKCISCCHKTNSLTKLINYLLSEMGLLTLHNYCAACSLGYLKSERSNRSLSIPEVSRVITVVRDVNVFQLLKKRSFRYKNDDEKSKTKRFLEVSFLIVFIHLVV